MANEQRDGAADDATGSWKKNWTEGEEFAREVLPCTLSTQADYAAARAVCRLWRDVNDDILMRDVEDRTMKKLMGEHDWRVPLLNVTKRNGRKQVVSVGKIVTRLERLAGKDLKVDCLHLARTVMNGLTHNISTSKLDVLAAEEASCKVLRHPDYLVLASRIAVSNLHKETTEDYASVVKRMLAGNQHTKRSAPLYEAACAEFVLAHAGALQEMLCFERDYLFSYFGFRTLCGSLTTVDGKIVERPQHLFLREAIGINKARIDRWRALGDGDDGEPKRALAQEILASIRETYQATSTHQYTHASPTKFNAATPLGQLASCFLLPVSHDGDSIEGIMEAAKRCALISQSAGGIGLSFSSVRATGAYIRGTNGRSRGIMPFLRIFAETVKAVDQGGSKRPGACAIYLDVWHADVFDFLKMKRIQSKSKDEVRAFELFQALWVCDLFMRRVEQAAKFTLFSPDETPDLITTWGDEFEHRYLHYEALALSHAEEATRCKANHQPEPTPPLLYKIVDALTLYEAIALTAIETGTPYVLFKDSANAKSNQQNLGTLRTSNLCVAGDTRVLTDRGQLPIGELVNQQVNVWNGTEWSAVTVRQTGANKNLLRVTLSNGTVLDCTPEHRFLRSDEDLDNPVHAKDLKVGDKLARLVLPPAFELEPKTPFLHPYVHGFLCGDDGTTPREQLPGAAVCSKEEGKKFAVPSDQNIETRLRWLEGYCDAIGTVVQKKNSFSLRVDSKHREFLLRVRLMLQTLGVNSTVTLKDATGSNADPPFSKGEASYCLEISGFDTRILLDLGFAPNRLVLLKSRQVGGQNGGRYPVVLNISQGPQNVDTFCFNEPIRHVGVFNGVATMNCSEVLEFCSEDETAVCNLASISLPAFVRHPYGDRTSFDYAALHATARLVCRNLNLVVDSTTYPLPSARKSNLRHRPIGIGIQGLADVYYMHRLAYLSEPARELNRRIFETIYHAAMTESVALAARDGTYETYAGSPLSQGKLQFDLWGDAQPTGLWDWDALRKELAVHGARNSLLLAPMPTASTSQILGNYECFESGSNVTARRTVETFFVVNKHLVYELRRMGLWYDRIAYDINAARGSVQHLPNLPAWIKEVYKTVWELPLKPQIDACRDRAAFICQSQSFNWHVAEPTQKLFGSALMYAWKKGLKTGMYYLRSMPASDAVQITNVARSSTTGGTSTTPSSAAAAPTTPPEEADEGGVCRMEPGCTSCGA